jgi:hypothetical protein
MHCGHMGQPSTHNVFEVDISLCSRNFRSSVDHCAADILQQAEESRQVRCSGLATPAQQEFQDY